MPTVGGNPLVSFVPIIAMFAIFYFLLIRPQQQQAKEHQKMLENLKKGDRILTAGGIYGTITGFKGNDLEVQITQNVKVTVARSGVSKLVNEGAGTPTAANGVAA